MILLKFLMNFIKVLNEEAGPRAIAAGAALGAVIGLTPKGSPHNLVILALFFFLNVNGSAGAFAAAVFTLFAYLGDPLFNKIGYDLLTAGPLRGFWTALYNTPAVPWTRFNNTLVLGSLVSSLILFWPLYFGGTWAVLKYRERVLSAVQKWKIMQAIKASKLAAFLHGYL